MEVLCSAFDVVRSCYYAHRLRRCRVDARRVALRSQVNQLFNQSRGSAGSRSILGMLREDGISIGRFRVRRLIRELGLVSKQPGSHAYKQATVERPDIPIPLPDQLSARQTMAIGTDGYTAMLCLMALERHGLSPERGEVLVTGANGGVGSFAIALLARLGYSVTASTGRPAEADYLKQLGASTIIDRSELSNPGRPLAAERWAAAIDSVGSHTLANVCASTRADGAVAACGLAQGMDFPATVAPFILRGVSLLGINSVTRPYEERVAAWQRLCSELDLAQLDDITREIALSEAIDAANDLLDGKVRGRVVVDVNR